MARLYANNASAVLNAGISDSDTTITVSAGQGSQFPYVDEGVDGNYLTLTLEDVNGAVEIVKCTQHLVGTPETFVVTRAQESTSAKAFVSGSRLELRATAASFNGWLQLDANATDAKEVYGGTFTDDDIGDEGNTVRVRYSVTPSDVPPDSLREGELAINIPDGKVWIGTAADKELIISGGGSGGGAIVPGGFSIEYTWTESQTAPISSGQIGSNQPGDISDATQLLLSATDANGLTALATGGGAGWFGLLSNKTRTKSALFVLGKAGDNTAHPSTYLVDVQFLLGAGGDFTADEEIVASFSPNNVTPWDTTAVLRWAGSDAGNPTVGQIKCDAAATTMEDITTIRISLFDVANRAISAGRLLPNGSHFYLANDTRTKGGVYRGGEVITLTSTYMEFEVHYLRGTGGALPDSNEMVGVNGLSSATDYLSVAELDAPREGEADASVDIQRAIDIIAEGGGTFNGGTVFIPAGRYRIDNTLVLKSGVRLLGSGLGTELFIGNLDDADPMLRNENQAASAGPDVHTDVGMAIRDVLFTGTGKATRAAPMIDFQKVGSVLLSECIFVNHSYGTVWVFGSNNVDLNKCSFTLTGKDTGDPLGVALLTGTHDWGGANESRNRNLKSLFTEYNSCPGGAIAFGGEKEMSLGDHVRNGEGFGIIVDEGADSTQITNVHIETLGASSFTYCTGLFLAGRNTIVTGGTIEECDGSGVTIGNVQGVVISNAIIQNNRQDAVNFGEAAGIEIRSFDVGSVPPQDILVSNCLIVDTQASATQIYGIGLIGESGSPAPVRNVQIVHNNFYIEDTGAHDFYPGQEVHNRSDGFNEELFQPGDFVFSHNYLVDGHYQDHTWPLPLTSGTVSWNPLLRPNISVSMTGNLALNIESFGSGVPAVQSGEASLAIIDTVGGLTFTYGNNFDFGPNSGASLTWRTHPYSAAYDGLTYFRPLGDYAAGSLILVECEWNSTLQALQPKRAFPSAP